MNSKKGSALSMLFKLVVLGMLLGVVAFGMVPLIQKGTGDADSISKNTCGVGLKDGRCSVAAMGDGWNCLPEIGCSEGVCCYCEDPDVCFGGNLFMNFGGGKQMEFRFEKYGTGSHLIFEKGTLTPANALDADVGLPNDRSFTIRYMPQSSDTTCELSITDGTNTKDFGEQECGKAETLVDGFSYLAGKEKAMTFNDIEDDKGNEICNPTADDTCKVTFKLKINGAESVDRSFDVYFER